MLNRRCSVNVQPVAKTRVPQVARTVYVRRSKKLRQRPQEVMLLAVAWCEPQLPPQSTMRMATSLNPSLVAARVSLPPTPHAHISNPLLYILHLKRLRHPVPCTPSGEIINGTAVVTFVLSSRQRIYCRKQSRNGTVAQRNQSL